MLRAARRASLRPRASLSPAATRSRQLTTESDPPVQDVSWNEFQELRNDRRVLVNSMMQYGSDQQKDNTWSIRDGLHRPPSEPTLSALLACGAHFGHATQIMNPNFMPYAYGTRAGVTVIDMEHTLPLLRRAAKVTRAIAYEGGQIVFVGTRPDLRPIVEKAAARVGPLGYHVGERWLPGTLTNKFQMFGETTVETQKVVPDLVIILNPLKNLNAIRECAVEHVPTIGIIDSNADPRTVMYAIPANDESTRTAELICGILSMAARAGVDERGKVFHEFVDGLVHPSERVDPEIQIHDEDADLEQLRRVQVDAQGNEISEDYEEDEEEGDNNHW
ncbi:ribosomal protein S2 [Hymenopellis radicata]|nr:ribosomal protein S2 [Hymenopellis radicata]